MTSHNQYAYMVFSIPSRADRAADAAAQRHPGHRRHPPPLRELPADGGRHRDAGDRRARFDLGGRAVAYGLDTLQQRPSCTSGPGDVVYEGMIVGENSRSGDMNVNPTKEKKLSNMRPWPRPQHPLEARPADVAGRGAGVHRGGRTGRGHADADPPAQDHAQRARPQACGAERRRR